MPLLRFLLLALLSVALSAHAAERPLARFSLTVTPPAEVKALLDRVLQTTAETGSIDGAIVRAIDREDEERLLRRLRGDAIDVLAAEGYFAPSINITADESGQVGYLVMLDLGRRTEIAELEIVFTGALADQPERARELRATWTLSPGQPFRDALWSEEKTRLLNRIRSRDFAAARLTDSLAEVDADAATARLRVEIDSGPAHTLGRVEVKGLSRYEPQLVARYQPFAAGDAYDAAKLLEFQRRLQRSPYFGTVIVDVDPARARDRELPVLVEVKEAQTRRLSLGLGYSTDTGIRAEASYRQSLLFGHPYTLVSGAGVDKTRGVAFADILLPPKPDDAQDSLGTLYERTDIERVRTRRWALGVQRAFPREAGPISYETRVAASFQHETRTVLDAPSEDTSNDVLAATYSFTRRNVDSITNPTRGALMTVAATVGLRRSGISELLNDTFVRVYGRYVRYLPLSPRDQLILRTELGTVYVDDPRTVPNEYLFRTGGVGTVRGYSFQSIGHKVGSATTGSKSLLVGSAEYVRWFAPDWGAALFYDIGDASDDLGSVSLAQGTGIGARWRTLAGPLALDFAYGERDRRWRLHFSIAIAF